VLAARTLPSGGTAWRARYTDPTSRKVLWKTLDATVSRTKEARAQWARSLSASLGKRRADLAAGIVPPAVRVTVEAALASHVATSSVTLRKRTAKTYAIAFGRFLAWAKSEGVTYVDEVSPARLANLRDAFIVATKRMAGRGGHAPFADKPRAPVTVNREFKTLSTLLTAWRRAGLVNLSSDQIADALRPLTTEQSTPKFLPAAKLRQVLEAALRHDAEEDRNVAPLAAFLTLTGVRLSEALTLKWSDVDLDAHGVDGKPVGEFRLRAENVKTKRGRVVGLEVSPGLRAILSAMRARPGVDAGGFVFGGDKSAATKARARLIADHGCPAFQWKDLRSTCSTFLTNAPGIFGAASAFHAAKMLGHSVTIAESKYAGLLRGILREARTLDAAMALEGVLSEVLAAV
jgi:integrase